MYATGMIVYEHDCMDFNHFSDRKRADTRIQEWSSVTFHVVGYRWNLEPGHWETAGGKMITGQPATDLETAFAADVADGYSCFAPTCMIVSIISQTCFYLMIPE